MYEGVDQAREGYQAAREREAYRAEDRYEEPDNNAKKLNNHMAGKTNPKAIVQATPVELPSSQEMADIAFVDTSFEKKFLQVRREIPAITKNKKNPFLGNEYYDINGLLSVVNPILWRHGMYLTQPLINLVDPTRGIIGAVRTILVDAESGRSFASDFPLIEGPKNDQAVGSSVSYTRRYMAAALFGLESEDDDGNAASGVVAQKGKTEILAKPVKVATPKVNIDKPPFNEGADENEDVLAGIV